MIRVVRAAGALARLRWLRRRRRAGLRAAALIGSAAVAAVALAAAGCGGGSSSGVAEVDTGAATTTTSAGGGTGSGSGKSARALKYAQCMRSNGVPNFPDPVNGRTTLRLGPNSNGVNPQTPQFKSAQQACKEFAPEGLAQGGDPQLQAAWLKYAKCMRSHGVPDFPDPNFSSGGITMQLPPATANSPQFKSAQQACRSLLPAGAGGQG
jgi:hypothetical protein